MSRRKAQARLLLIGQGPTQPGRRTNDQSALFEPLSLGDESDGSLSINADARILGATLKAGETLDYEADPARHLYLVSSGRVDVNGTSASPRDGIAITGEQKISITAEDDSELVLVDAR